MASLRRVSRTRRAPRRLLRLAVALTLLGVALGWPAESTGPGFDPGPPRPVVVLPDAGTALSASARPADAPATTTDTPAVAPVTPVGTATSLPTGATRVGSAAGRTIGGRPVPTRAAPRAPPGSAA